MLSRRGELNPRPLPYQGSALPLSYSRLISSKEIRKLILPIFNFTVSTPFEVGRAGFEPTKAFASRFTVCPSWPLWYLPI